MSMTGEKFHHKRLCHKLKIKRYSLILLCNKHVLYVLIAPKGQIFGIFLQNVTFFKLLRWYHQAISLECRRFGMAFWLQSASWKNDHADDHTIASESAQKHVIGYL